MSSGKILKAGDVALYSMPYLEDDGLGTRVVSQDSEEVQRSAYEEGFISGEKAGLAAGEEKAKILMEGIGKVFQEIVECKDSLAGNLENQVVDLAVAMAGRIILDEINVKPEKMLPVVKEALKKLQKTGKVTIRLNPVLYEIIKNHSTELTEIHDDIKFDVVEQMALSNPVIKSEVEEVITDIDSLLMHISEDLRKVSRERTAEDSLKSDDKSEDEPDKVADSTLLEEES